MKILSRNNILFAQFDQNYDGQVPESIPADLIQADGGFFLTAPVTTNAASVDVAFYFILVISLLSFAALAGTMFYSCVVNRRVDKRIADQLRPQETESLRTSRFLFPICSAVVAMLVAIDIFYLGLRGYLDMTNPPVGALPITVVGKNESWSFSYPNGHVDRDLHVPVNRPVALQLKSSDIRHHFFAPALRLRAVAIPGQTSRAWFEGNRPGKYLAVDSHFSGKDHQPVWARIVVHEPNGYEQWLNDVTDPFRTKTPLQVGELLYTKLACITCHSQDGSPRAGPSLMGLMSRQAKLVGGATVAVDDEYLRRSIKNPQAEVVEGFNPVMPKFEGLITERELSALVEYLKTL